MTPEEEGNVMAGRTGLVIHPRDALIFQKRQGALKSALPFLENEGVAWMNDKSCASCHHVPFLLWSHNKARARGIGVDEKKLVEWMKWTREFSTTRREWFRLTNDFGDNLP